IRGADLCQYTDAYGQTRSQYMNDMVKQAKDLMEGGAKGAEALNLLVAFNSLYDKNQEIAVRYQYLDVTLESTLKAYMDQFYRQINPREKKVSFQYVDDIINVVNAAKAGMRDGNIDNNLIKKLDYIAYGTYALGPNCQGDIQVTLHLIGSNGTSESFVATGRPETVMSTIASDIFTLFQRTQFPSQIKIGSKMLTLVGGLNGSVDRVPDPKLAEEACSTLDARLPTSTELDLLNGYGDWSGGVSLNHKIWAMPDDKVFAPDLRNPTPVREKWEVNADEYLYYCVK
ncbi:MAG: hypothetical protein ACXVLQ_02450, partial [Bacteriovorax sp.]